MTEPHPGRDFASLVEHYHDAVRRDFGAIPEPEIWKRPVPGQVSSANLVLHLTGNLRHFFGHVLGGSDYVREREREFLDEPGADRTEILAGWDAACEEAKAVLRSLDRAALDRNAPVSSWPGGDTVHIFVLRLIAHLAYHAGQIRTHFRIFVPEP